MAEKEFLLGNRARELLKYTKHSTRVVSDDVSQKVFGQSSGVLPNSMTSGM